MYNVGRLPNPENQTKQGTLGGVNPNEDICAYVARYCDNYRVALCPGVAGKPPAQRLKAMYDRLRPLYSAIGIPTCFKNRLCNVKAAMLWGGTPTDPEYFLSEQDFGARAQIISIFTPRRATGAQRRN